MVKLGFDILTVFLLYILINGDTQWHSSWHIKTQVNNRVAPGQKLGYTGFSHVNITVKITPYTNNTHELEMSYNYINQPCNNKVAPDQKLGYTGFSLVNITVKLTPYTNNTHELEMSYNYLQQPCKTVL